MDASQHILVVDDDEGILSALSLLLKSEGYQPITTNNPRDALSLLRQNTVSTVLMDLNYSRDTTSGEEGLQLISDIRVFDELTPIVVMTGWGTVDVAVKTMQNGANDFVQKPWENERLLAIIANQLKLANAQLQSQKLSLQNQLLRDEITPASQLIAESPVMKQVLSTLEQVAATDVSVLLTGENGTGKSLFARYLHELSSRRNATFVSVNMGAITESLFESEMFGHVKGAFTDAKSTRIGRFELADEGTLFLDEIANTPLSQQVKLLRVLEESQFEKVGSAKTQKVDTRLISATNSDLLAAVTAGHFRKDLLYRINTIEIEVPALRHRREDILPLADSFLQQVAKKYGQPVCQVSDQARTVISYYNWPGNVRELSHVMERAHILCKNSVVSAKDLGLGEATNSVCDNRLNAISETDLRPFADIEAELIAARMAYYDGDAQLAAKSLGLSRSAFYRRLDKLKN